MHDIRGQVANQDKLDEVEAGAKQINLVEDTTNKGKLIFTNYDGEETSLQGGFLPDEKTITLNEDNELVAVKVVKNEDGTTVLKLYATQEELNKITEDLEKALADEIKARQDADEVLQDNIDAEETARIDADTLLENKIDTEIARAEAVEQSLRNDLTKEISDREAADKALDKKITDETTARETKDNELQTAIEGLSKALSEKVILRRWN